MIRLARLSIRRPRAALGFWAILAIAATLDALVVRPVLLPAAVSLMGRWSWWPTTAPGVPPASRPVPPIAPKGA